MRYRIFLLPLIAGALLAAKPARAALPALPPNPAPMAGAANDCGRSQIARLNPLLATQIVGVYPAEAARRNQMGHVLMRAVVGKDGAAKEVVVVVSSGHALLDDAAVATVKEKWRWDGVPAECRERGAVIPVTFQWYPDGFNHQQVYLDDPAYPPEARARKVGGTAGVLASLLFNGGIVFANLDVPRAQIGISTGSTEMDTAILNYVKSWKFFRDREKEAWTSPVPVVIELIPTNNPATIETLMGPATATPPPETEPLIASNLPPPGVANDCGRTGKTSLPPIMSSRAVIDIPRTPPITVKHQSGFYLTTFMTMQFAEQGAMRMHILVDRNGNAGEVAITDSSAPPEMEKAVTTAIKAKYRWEVPPPECRERGVMLDLDYIYAYAPPPLQIYADDPRYPAVAHERKMGGAGVVRMTYKSPDKITDADILVSTGSPALDDSMTKAIADLILPTIKDNSQPESVTQIFYVMFMPDFVTSPRQSTARASTAP